MPVVREPKIEPLPGYRLLEPLGCGGFGEVWKCEAPGGIYKAIKFVFGDPSGLEADNTRAEEELRAIQHIKAIRHPFLLSIDRVEKVDGELVIVTELADQNLYQVLQGHQAQGRQGIPREELLGYLLETAEVLDLMNIQYQLQHLDVKPRNLFLVSNHIKVADFGLVSSLSGGEGAIQLGAITPLYASPEIFLGKLSRHCDQYSLAIVYQEMLTGRLPFDGKNVRQLLLLHTTQAPDLSPLAEHDRAVLARALAKEPEQRFGSCREFVRALVHEPLVVPAASLPRSPADQQTLGGQVRFGPADTLCNLSAQTDTWTSKKTPPLPAEVVPGFDFVECLGSNPFLDQWKVAAPDGTLHLVKIIYGYSARGGLLEETVTRLQSLLHPALVPTGVVHWDPGRVVLLTDLVKATLRDRAHECQARQFPGIMRGELLDYLRTAAEALDYLYQQHSLQHLGLNPRNLVLLADGRVQIAEFGLAHLLWLPGGHTIATRNARYAAPELFDRQVSRHCDQYSLALIYNEMLTGIHPLRGGGRGQGQLQVDKLPELDRQVIARALDPDPAKRYPSCMDLVRALEGSDDQAQAQEKPDRFTSLLTEARSGSAPALLPADSPADDLNQIIRELVVGAGGEVSRDDNPLPVLDEGGEVLHYQFQAGLPLGSARLKLDEFAKQWYAQLRRDDVQGCIFHIDMPTNFWRQWIGRQPGLQVQVRLGRVHAMSATPIEVVVEIRAFRCRKKRGRQLLQDMGPALLDSLRNYLLINAEKRSSDRLLWPYPVTIRPLDKAGHPGAAIQCQGKDISLSGMGFYLPEELETSEVLIDLPNTLHPPSIAVPATLVRAKRTADGWYDVGALFRVPALRKTRPELQVS